MWSLWHGGHIGRWITSSRNGHIVLWRNITVRLCLGYHYSVETLSARYAEGANVVWADFGDARGGLYLMLGPMELSAVHRDTTEHQGNATPAQHPPADPARWYP